AGGTGRTGRPRRRAPAAVRTDWAARPGTAVRRIAGAIRTATAAPAPGPAEPTSTGAVARPTDWVRPARPLPAPESAPQPEGPKPVESKRKAVRRRTTGYPVWA